MGLKLIAFLLTETIFKDNEDGIDTFAHTHKENMNEIDSRPNDIEVY